MKSPSVVYEVRSKRDGLEGVFLTRDDANAYAADLAWAFAERTDVVEVPVHESIRFPQEDQP